MNGDDEKHNPSRPLAGAFGFFLTFSPTVFSLGYCILQGCSGKAPDGTYRSLFDITNGDDEKHKPRDIFIVVYSTICVL